MLTSPTLPRKKIRNSLLWRLLAKGELKTEVCQSQYKIGKAWGCLNLTGHWPPACRPGNLSSRILAYSLNFTVLYFESSLEYMVLTINREDLMDSSAMNYVFQIDWTYFSTPLRNGKPLRWAGWRARSWSEDGSNDRERNAWPARAKEQDGFYHSPAKETRRFI